ncbi:SusC/RagA family TonB-linked outer membrane protein, partial [uncultured Parabacteroides sp.]
MRLSVVFLFLSLGIAVANNSYAQNTTLSLEMSNSTIANVLEAVENQTDFSFIYDANVVNINKKVSVSVNEKNIFDVLNKMFGNSDIAYTVVNKKIILNKKETIEIMQQQGKRVTGVVVDKNNEPVIGANILVKGTTNGTITDVDGNYVLENVPADAILVFSYIGFDSQELKYNGQANIDVTLSEDTQKLDEVVVTAMGIKKKAASLTYSSQQVGGDELTRAKDPNMITALAGKTAGVQINKNSSGLGGSAKISIRGVRSANADANNQPLYVIDGVPMLNSISEQASSTMGGKNNGGNRDSGDGISNLNPDDIESMSILKGASAAALYGSQAANGVILITTKKGKAGLQRVTFSSNLTVDHAISLPEFQNEYGRKDNMSWGKAGNLQDYDNAGDFFQNGVTAINSLSLTRGNDKLQTYFSYANTSASGIVEKNKLQKHNLNFRETAQFFDDRLNIDANVNLMTQSIKNRPTSGGYYMNPLVGLYGFPRGEDIAPYRDGYETTDFERNMPVQNWHTDINSFEQNPYWLVNRVTSRDKRYRALASLTAAVTVTDWLKIQARGNVDYTNDKFQQKMYATTSVDIAGTNGRYIDLNHTEMLLYGDVMAMVNKKWNDWSLNAAVGSSINSTRVDELRLDSKTASLYYPNVFTVANINMSTSAGCDEIINQRRTLQSVFATAQVGWKESLYLDVTARND